MKKNKTAEKYSWIVLLTSLVIEITTIIGIRTQCQNLIILSLVLLLFLSTALIIMAYACNKILFLPNKMIFTKLMSNAIAPNWLGALYLLFFVIHIGWLTDGSLNYFQSSNNNFTPVTTSVLTSIIGMFVLICFFPEGKPNKENAQYRVFVSGISLLGKKEITLNYADKNKYSNISLYNVEPLVKIFSLCFDSKKVDKSNVRKLLILSSNAHYQTGYFKDSVVEIGINKEELDEWKELFNTDITDIIVPDKSEESGDTIKVYFKLVDTAPVEDILRTVIRIAAMQVFPKEKVFFKNLIIEFTQKCDYDRFDQCFEVLNDAIKKEDTVNQLLYFNLTPGTGIVGSLMTLFSLDKYRGLYFYAQYSSKELLPVDKSKVPLENLLSQALEI